MVLAMATSGWGLPEGTVMVDDVRTSEVIPLGACGWTMCALGTLGLLCEAYGCCGWLQGPVLGFVEAGCDR